MPGEMIFYAEFNMHWYMSHLSQYHGLYIVHYIISIMQWFLWDYETTPQHILQKIAIVPYFTVELKFYLTIMTVLFPSLYFFPPWGTIQVNFQPILLAYLYTLYTCACFSPCYSFFDEE